MRTCPECGASVKLENMKRHYANVHPGQDATAAISAEEHREVRRAARVGGPSFYRQRAFQAVAVVVVLVVAGYFGLPYILGAHSGTGFDLIGYCGGEGTVEHYHPLLLLYDAGLQRELPADIGISPSETNPAYVCVTGSHAIHTHDASGIIHLELPTVPPSSPTLAQFFTIWGQPLSTSAVAGYSGRVTATMYDSDTRSTTDFSSDPGSIPLYVSPLGPTANPYPIPSSLIWNGIYGTGQSGGYFVGEIIWLNVTA